MRSKAVTSRLIVVAVGLVCLSALAAPTPPTGPMTVEGTIEDVAWFPAHTVEAIPGMSGSAGRDRQFPARYRVILAGPIVSGENVGPFKGRDRITIWLDHEQDDGFLQKGERIRVTGYIERGDEGGTWTSCESIEQLPHTSSPQGQP